MPTQQAAVAIRAPKDDSCTNSPGLGALAQAKRKAKTKKLNTTQSAETDTAAESNPVTGKMANFCSICGFRATGPATTRSIEWHQYEASYPQTDTEYGSDVLSVCRELLDAHIPCVWIPKGGSDNEVADIRAFIETVQPDLDKSNGSPKLAAMECWNIWVFHAFVPKQKTLRARSIPPQFNEVCNGHINWKTPESEPPSHSPNTVTFQQQSSNSESSSSSSSSYDSKMIHGLFHRALDNLVDRALLPLSIVRFGFRQWITLS
ncbi:hypothetical protein LPJ64_004931, partial [Coemansia asiatica]